VQIAERERESRQGKGIERKWEEKRRVFFSVAAMPAAQGRAELGSSPDLPDHADDDGKILQTNVFSLSLSRLVCALLLLLQVLCFCFVLLL
jgi:hypothetical protein